LHRSIALVKALLLSRKKFTWIFSFLRKSQKNKKSIFLAPTAKNGFNGRNFYYTWIQLTLYNNWQQFGSNRRQKNFRKKPCTPPFCIIFTSENHLNAHSPLIKQHMAINFAPLDGPCQGASSESKKIYLDFFIFWVERNLPGFFHFWENRKKTKKSIFLAPTAKNGFNGRNFYYTWIQLTLYNNWQQFGSNRRQNFFRKKPCTPPFYIIFTSENHLNAHSSLIKQHMAMNFAPFDCPCQGASSESKKLYLDFFIFEKIAKNQKIHIFGSHSKKWVQWTELLLYLNSTDPIQ
jgi:hypothetical protein